MKKFRLKVIWILVRYSVPVRDGTLAYLNLPVQNLWTALLVLGIMLWAYKKPNER